MGKELKILNEELHVFSEMKKHEITIGNLINFNRKPLKISDLPVNDLSRLPKDTQIAIDDFPHFTPINVYNKNRIQDVTLTTTFNPEVINELKQLNTNIFLITMGKSGFFDGKTKMIVNTEGYNYARYAALLVDDVN